MPQTVTGSIETQLNSELILEFLADARHLPQWAPGFADSVDFETGNRWRVRKGEQTFSIEVIVDRSSKTVDFVRDLAPGKKGGAYVRVLTLPDGGSALVMTLPVLAASTTESVREILNAELNSIISLSASMHK